MNKLYVTHCSAKKASTFKRTGSRVPPDRLYISKRIQGFMRSCKMQGVKWAIFSDEYGLWFPHLKKKWYEKPPDDVTAEEFESLVRDFDKKVRRYDEVWFYHHPARFHKLYRGLLRKSRCKNKIVRFTKISKIL